jgi:maleylacetoacetate isomerase
MTMLEGLGEEPEIRLHDYWRSSASYRVRIALALKGISYRRTSVDLQTDAHKVEAYLQLNPQGVVPTLEIDGRVLTQSLAMIEYLDETRPNTPLLSSDPAERAQARAIALAIASQIHPISNLGVLSRVEAMAGKDERNRWNRDNLRIGLECVERMVGSSGLHAEFCQGSSPGLADCVLIPQLYNAARWDVDFGDLPCLTRIEQSCQQHPAFIAAHPANFEPSQTDGLCGSVANIWG